MTTTKIGVERGENTSWRPCGALVADRLTAYRRLTASLRRVSDSLQPLGRIFNGALAWLARAYARWSAWNSAADPPVLTCSKNDEEARFSLDKASKTFYVYLFVVFSSASFFHVSFLLRLQFGSKAKGVVVVVVVVTEDGNADGSFFRFF